MAGARHAPDTLFLILEENFRVCREAGVGLSEDDRGEAGFAIVEDEEITREEELYLIYADRLANKPLHEAALSCCTIILVHRGPFATYPSALKT